MASIFNQYSLMWMVILLLGVAGFILFRKKPRLPQVIAFFAIIAGLSIAWLVLRPTQTPLADTAAEVKARIGAGKPVLLEFQSPY